MATIPRVGAGSLTVLFDPASTPVDGPDVDPVTGDERQTFGPDGKPL